MPSVLEAEELDVAVQQEEVVFILCPELPEPGTPRHKKRNGQMHPVEHFLDLLRQTLDNIRRNKLRSFLTLFGIAWGIASLVLMSALSDGFRAGQRQNMSQIGDNI